MDRSQAPQLSSHEHPLRVGLLGCGVVGSAVARGLSGPGFDDIAGRPLTLERIGVLHPDKPRGRGIDAGLITSNAWDVVTDPRVQVIVEAIGGIYPALDLLRAALGRGIHVVTANKELVARHGDELQHIASLSGAAFLYEASVCGAVPVLRTLRTSFQVDDVQCITGIVNGTTNFVLTRVQRDGWSLEGALREARELGYAEPGSDADLSGWDAAYKLSILCNVAFGARVDPAEITRQPITEETDLNVPPGKTLKQVAHAALGPDGLVAEVRLVALPDDAPLARVDGVDNGVLIRGRSTDGLLLVGQGAGGVATAQAVFADLAEIAARPHGPRLRVLTDRLPDVAEDLAGCASAPV